LSPHRGRLLTAGLKQVPSELVVLQADNPVGDFIFEAWIGYSVFDLVAARQNEDHPD